VAKIRNLPFHGEGSNRRSIQDARRLSMAVVRDLARFVSRADASQLTDETKLQLRIRLLDTLACAYGALDADLVRRLKSHVAELAGDPPCGLIGGGRAAPDRAAFYNGALIRYLDFNDSYLAPGETCHPSDNTGALLAAGEMAQRTGTDLLVAMAVAYQVQCRLSDEAPVRDKGFDHTVQGAYAAAAGVAKALDLDEERTAHAIAIAGTSLNALRVTRTGSLSHWKGLAAPAAACGATHAALLAKHGVTGPDEVFEGTKGLMDSITGPFEIDWEAEGLDRIHRTILKKYNAEIHSQSAIEALIGLRADTVGAQGAPTEVEAIELETFDVAHDIIGGGAEGDKTRARTKEEADHSLPYILAVAWLDGDVLPAQYDEERIAAADVQQLLQRVRVRPADELSARFPEEMPARVTVRLRGGETLEAETADYEGFHTRPMSWSAAVDKFERLASRRLARAQRGEVVSAVERIEELPVPKLVELLSTSP
jgi:2-methylcitrate dehydratase